MCCENAKEFGYHKRPLPESFFHRRSLRSSSYLDAAVANGRTSQVKERFTLIPFRLGKDKEVSSKETLVSGLVKDKFEALDLAVAQGLHPILGQQCDTGAQARSETSRGHHTDRDIGSSQRGELMAHGFQKLEEQTSW